MVIICSRTLPHFKGLGHSFGRPRKLDTDFSDTKPWHSSIILVSPLVVFSVGLPRHTLLGCHPADWGPAPLETSGSAISWNIYFRPQSSLAAIPTKGIIFLHKTLAEDEAIWNCPSSKNARRSSGMSQ
jgi:hypothetical protein